MARKEEPLSIILLGLGNVGRELVGQLFAAQGRFPWLRLIGLADRSGLWLVPGGFAPGQAAAALAHQATALPLSLWGPALPESEVVPGSEVYSPDLVLRLDELGALRAAIVDLAASAERYPA